ncbi:MAG: DNA cytosine methyltransferase [Sphingopyxis sp.]|nr:DNA cytosine methyltransferase [Sphingopyxis sp.]
MGITGLYAGIGGFELGFQAAGHKPLLLADKDPSCRTVLATRFPDALIAGDVGDLTELPSATEIVTAGFPCQNLSMAGDKMGIAGSKSRDVSHLFQLLETGGPTLVIENVYFMLQLDKGAAMASLVDSVEQLGYQWAYRVVNTMAFGLPQRRRRVFFVASARIDPREALFADEATAPIPRIPTLSSPLGFYWTEGRNGVGLAVDAIPPLKIASGLGIPSAPAVLFPDGRVLTPSIEACERLQGFPIGWTSVEFEGPRSPRWSMVGNAVSVPAARWLGGRLREPGPVVDTPTQPLAHGDRWPSAAFGSAGKRWAISSSEFPVCYQMAPIGDFHDDKWTALSSRALKGFISRARAGGLRFPDGFLAALDTALVASERSN